MNRRNFLKLFGLLAVPSSVLALPAPIPEPQKGMIIITVDLAAGSADEQYKVDTGYNYDHQKEWMDFCPTETGLSSSNAFYYGTDKEIVIQFSGGSEIKFEPDWNNEYGEFNDIHISKSHDTIGVFL